VLEYHTTLSSGKDQLPCTSQLDHSHPVAAPRATVPRSSAPMASDQRAVIIILVYGALLLSSTLSSLGSEFVLADSHVCWFTSAGTQSNTRKESPLPGVRYSRRFRREKEERSNRCASDAIYVGSLTRCDGSY
jgi:hypothetical protein